MPRPTKYCPEIVEKITAALRDGNTRRYACRVAGIDEQTFANWLVDKSGFLEQVNEAEAEYREWEAKELVGECKKSLKTLIMGTTLEETETILVPNEDGGPEIKQKRVRTKQVPPSATAIIFALSNRDPENWKNRYSAEVNGKVQTEEVPADLSQVPDDIIRQAVEAINKGAK